MSADLIEIRLDMLRSQNELWKIAKAVRTPLIATNRSKRNKGSFDGTETDRLTTLSNAIDHGFSYVDLENSTTDLDETVDSLRSKGAKIILSHHDHYRTPKLSVLESIRAKLQTQKPDVAKIVTTAKWSQDNLTILELLDNRRPANSAIVGFAMGKTGVWSRIMSPFYGGAFTYAALEKGLETATGQPTISDLRTVYQTLGLG